MEAYQGQLLNKAEMFWEVPSQGCGQENGAGPTFWVLISTPLLKALRKLGFGTDFKGAMSSQCVVFVAYAFVDDTNMIETAKIQSG